MKPVIRTVGDLLAVLDTEHRPNRLTFGEVPRGGNCEAGLWMLRHLKDKAGRVSRDRLMGMIRYVVKNKRKSYARALGLSLADFTELAEDAVETREQQRSTANRAKGVNSRMLAKVQEDSQNGTQECYGWTCGEWAEHLKCSKASVVATKTWRMLHEHRLALKADRAITKRRVMKRRRSS